jgi:hypothetical protein
MDGNTHEVVSAYESAMARGNTNGHSQDRGTATKARFLSWGIAEPGPEQPHTLATVGPIALKFVVQVTSAVHMGHHGVTLYNHDRQLIWGWAIDNVELEPGVHELRYSFPMLPVRPGPYSWAVSLYEEGQLLDAWECLPEMIVATENFQHRYDHWSGVLNIPSKFSIT